MFRLLVCWLCAAWLTVDAAPTGDGAPPLGSPLPPWREGLLDIHHIATGRGNATLIIAPDGTSLLIDAGATADGGEFTLPTRPDPSRRPGEWIGRYVQRHLRATGRSSLDYCIVTHLHPDHVGDVRPAAPLAPDGDYRLTGIMDVAHLVPIVLLIDRGFPDYNHPAPPHGDFALNYLAFVAARKKSGGACAALRVGASDQIVLRHAPKDFPTFVVRNLAANAVVWTGVGEQVGTSVPPLGSLAPADYPDENMCSIALRLSYGRFDYYSGGDLACDTREGAQPWRDIETPVARAAGPVAVAVANHHGYFDAVGPECVRALRPLVWVIPAWHATHPNIAQLERLVSDRVYPEPHDVFTTDLTPASRLLNDRFLKQVKSTAGHIVIRVEPGGGEFRVCITDNRDEADTVLAVFGPYRAQ